MTILMTLDFILCFTFGVQLGNEKPNKALLLGLFIVHGILCLGASHVVH